MHTHIPDITDTNRASQFKHWAKEWRNLREEEKEVYREKAKTINFKFPETDEELQKEKEQLLKNFNQNCKNLNRLGIPVTAGAVRDGEVFLLGNPAGREYLRKNGGILSSLSTAMDAGSVSNAVESTCKTDMMKTVQELFNKKYGEYLGKESAVPVPYKKIKEERTETMTGLPDGVSFKRPSSYGCPKLKQIIAVQERLKFQQRDDSETSNNINVAASIMTEVEIPQSASTVVEVASRGVESEPVPCDKTISNLLTNIQQNLNQHSSGEVNADKASKTATKKKRKIPEKDYEDTSSVKVVKKSSEIQMSEKTYIIEKIVRERIINGKIHYRIKWKGYAGRENTWEPSANIDKYYVDQFMETKLNQKLKKMKKVSS